MMVDDMIIVGVSSGELGSIKDDYTFRGSIVALAQTNGAERWRIYVTEDDETSGAGVSVWSSPSIDIERKLAFIGTGQTYEEPASPMSDSLLAIEYETGEVAWWRQFTENDVYTLFMMRPQGPDADIGAAPNLFTIAGRDVVGVGDKGGVYAVFDRETGDEVWATMLGPGSHLGGVMAPAAYADERLYITSNSWPMGFDTSVAFLPDFELPENTSDLIALDANDGTELWRTAIASPTIGGALYVNGVVFSGHTLGLVQAFDAADGEVLWEDRAGATLASGQVVSNGRLFVTHGFAFIGITGATDGTPGGLRVYGLP
jgi:polyvinyl alcohol dehydrogenase (cytochrome)